jgi:hypothetical protein
MLNMGKTNYDIRVAPYSKTFRHEGPGRQGDKYLKLRAEGS